MDDKWMVNLPYEAVEKLRNDVQTARLEAEELRKKLAEAQLGGADSGSIATELQESLREALKIIQWAQGNYDPETVRGWPHEALVTVANTVRTMPGATHIEKEWAGDALKYASFAATVDRFRKEGRHKELAKVPRDALGKGDYEAAAQALAPEQAVQDVQHQPSESSDAQNGA